MVGGPPGLTMVGGIAGLTKRSDVRLLDGATICPCFTQTKINNNSFQETRLLVVELDTN